MRTMRRFVLLGLLCLTITFCLSAQAAHAAEIVDSGELSSYAHWELTDDGTLAISATREAGSINNQASNAWGKYKSQILHVIIEPGITAIGRKAFFNCYNLRSVQIPDTLTAIEDDAFNSCFALENVCIPDSVTVLREGAFFKCRSLEEVRIPDSVVVMEVGVFEACTNLKKAAFGRGMTKVPQNTFAGCSSLTDVELPDTITSLVGGCFRECTSLKSFEIPETVEIIGSSLFYECTGLISVNIPDGVTRIGEYAFYRCSNLVSVRLPDTLTSIGKQVFSGCESLEHIVLPAALTTIKVGAFEKCTALRTIALPSGFTTLETGVFSDCSSLVDAMLSPNLTSIPASTFSNCTSLLSIAIPDSVTSIGSNAFNNCTSLEHVLVGHNLKEFGNYTFYRCHLKTVTILSQTSGYFAVNDEAFKLSDVEDVYFEGMEGELHSVYPDYDLTDLFGKNVRIHYLVPERKVAVISTNRSMELKTGTDMGLSFGFLRVQSGILESSWQQMALTLSDPTVISLSAYEVTPYGYGVTATALKAGETYLTVTDTDSGLSTTVRIRVYDDYAQTRSYAVDGLPTFYPKTWKNESKIETNIYDMSGLYVNSYACEKTAGGYSVSFDVYNECPHAGAVDIFDADGKWIGWREIKKFEALPTKIWTAGEQLYYLIDDFRSGDIWTYQQDSVAKKTSVSFKVPDGGFFTISNNAAESFAAFMLNSLDMTLNSLKELSKGIGDYEAAYDALTGEVEEELLSNEEILNSVLDAFKTSLSKELKNAVKKAGKAGFKDILQDPFGESEGEGFFSAFVDSISSSLDLKGCLKIATGIGEQELYKYMGPAGAVLKAGFKWYGQSNAMMQIASFLSSANNTFATVYTPGCGSYINQYGVTVDTGENVDAESVMQVFRVIDAAVEETLPGFDEAVDNAELYNICFVKSDETVQPSGLVKITLPVPDGLDPATCVVWRQEEDGTWTALATWLEEGFLVFETDHFSRYAVMGSRQVLVVESLPERQDYRPGDVLDTEGLRVTLNGETLEDGYICTPRIFTGNGEQTVTVHYGAAETTFTVMVMDVPFARPMAQKHGDTLHYSADLPCNGETAYVLIVSYDEDGRFVGVQIQEVSCRGEYENTVEVDGSTADCRIFEADVLCDPMCEAWTDWDYWTGLE
ncbi:MAG: leucine-rich repeat protein [Clostridia bacterium]|nr:leucine-rich repeat protein [Clostridia bacterium]